MIEIKWYAEAGKAVFTASRLWGSLRFGLPVDMPRRFHRLAPKRRGLPFMGFTRLDEKPIGDHSQLYRCD